MPALANTAVTPGGSGGGEQQLPPPPPPTRNQGVEISKGERAAAAETAAATGFVAQANAQSLPTHVQPVASRLKENERKSEERRRIDTNERGSNRTPNTAQGTKIQIPNTTGQGQLRRQAGRKHERPNAAPKCPQGGSINPPSEPPSATETRWRTRKHQEQGAEAGRGRQRTERPTRMRDASATSHATNATRRNGFSTIFQFFSQKIYKKTLNMCFSRMEL